MFLRQSTAQSINFGPFSDSADGVTPQTGLTITQSDILISKSGGALTQKNAAGNAVHDADGFYRVTLDATDTDTTGILKLESLIAGVAPVWETYFVCPGVIYDSLFGGATNAFDLNGLVGISPTGVIDLVAGMGVDGETYEQVMSLIRDSNNTIVDDGVGNATIFAKDGITPRFTYTYVVGGGSRTVTSVNPA